MAIASKTVNPLHFEDLEPHRFEDLIRQLAHGYREWLDLDATGRLGKDDGLDIRGIESVRRDNSPIVDDGSEPDDPDDVEEARLPETRVWRIQCKRYKKITPQLMRTIVHEVVPHRDNAPYGLIVAAACDVTAATINAFHDEAAKLAVAEHHLWLKANIEDLLFAPEHDHLLFAYFNLSLATRRRSNLQELRAYIAVKRKLLRAFQIKSVTERFHADVLIRDIDNDVDYPWEPEGHINERRRSWFEAIISGIDYFGLRVQERESFGWVRLDGSWDILPDALYAEHYEEIHALIPEGERAWLAVNTYIPVGAILEVDPMGTPMHPYPHLFSRYYDPQFGPFRADDEDKLIETYTRRWTHSEYYLDPEERRPLFAEAFKWARSELRRMKVGESLESAPPPAST